MLIERIDPPFWWVGMRCSHLELMVCGEDIASSAPELLATGVRLQYVRPGANDRYLFLGLDIDSDAIPGLIILRFVRHDTHIEYPYELRERAPGSATRTGIGNADVILNLVPDRWSRGGAGNGDLPGFHDKVDRNNLSSGRHGGDLAGMTAMLGYVADMGFTALWPTPLTESNQDRYSYHGYATTDGYRIDPRFGSNEEYRGMVEAARAKGIGVIQDIVLNHIGSQHWWMRDPPAPDWITHEGVYVPSNHALTTTCDPYASQSDRESYIAGWFDRSMPDLNHRNPHLATYQIQNAIWWIEYAGLAGIRADTYGYSSRTFLAEWSRRIMLEYPDFTLIGEVLCHNPVTISYWLKDKINRDGYVSHLSGVMDYPLAAMLRKALLAEEGNRTGLFDLYSALVDDVLYPNPERLVLFEGNHDMPRLFTALSEDLALWKMALTYVLTMPRIPQLYYGTEILLTSPIPHDDGGCRQDFPGGWEGDSVDAVSGVGLTSTQREAQAFVRTLLQWRKRLSVIHTGKLLHFMPQDGAYVYFRYHPGDAREILMVVLNKNIAQVSLSTKRYAEILNLGAWCIDITSGEQFQLGAELQVAPRAVRIVVVRPEASSSDDLGRNND